MEKHNNVNIYNMHRKPLIYTGVHAHLHTHTAQQTSRCPLLPVQFSFMHMANLSHSHFPTESPTPFPPGHRHLSPPILTHSFLLAMLRQTPAITPTLPTRLHGSVIGRCCDGCSFEPIADESQVVMRRETVQWPSWPAEDGVEKRRWMQRNRRTLTHTHIAWDHSAAQSTWGPDSGCQFCCDVSFMSLLCGLFLKHVDGGILLAFDRFPYIHRLLITHVNAPIGWWIIT